MSPYPHPNLFTTLYRRCVQPAFSLLILLTILLSGFSPGPPAAAKAAAPSTITLIGTNEGEYPGGDIPRYQKFEITFAIDETISNPYNFDEIWVEGVFTSAATGEMLVQPGFYYQDYAVEGVNIDLPDSANEQLTPVGEPVWKVRFAPKQLGNYTYTIRYKLNKVQQPSQLNGTFTVVEGYRHGFITRPPSPEYNLRYFIFNDLTPFIGTGLNVGWWERDSHGLSTYQFFLNRMAEVGANLARVWMTNSVPEKPGSSGLTAEKILSLQDRTLGRDYNLNDAWKFDRILEEAESNNTFLILTLEDGHMFGYDKAESGQYTGGMWENENLYNVKNGGILTNPYDYFKNEGAGLTARLYAKRLYRYIIARWGYSTSIMSWEHFNEIDELVWALPDDASEQDGWSKLYNWLLDMNTFIRTSDAHHHLIDNSMGSFNPEVNVLPGQEWRLQVYQSAYAPLDFAQMHYYHVEGLPSESGRVSDPEGRDMAALTWHYTQQGLEAYPEKPLVIGEFGLVKYNPSTGGWVNSPWLDWDDRGVHLHNGLWASLMSGAAVAGLQWHWHQYWLPDQAWWRHYSAISDFLYNMDIRRLRVLDPIHIEATDTYVGVFTPSGPGASECTDDLCSNHPYLRVMGLREENTKASYLWIQNRKNTWWNYVHGWQWACGAAGQPSAELVSGTVRVKGLNPNTAYLIEWWDTYDTSNVSMVIRREQMKTGEFATYLDLPVANLKEDVAVKILPVRAALHIQQSVSQPVVQAGGQVKVTMQMWNRGNVNVSSLVVQSDACGDFDAGALAANSPTPYTLECWVEVDRDTEWIVSAVGQDPALNPVQASTRSFVAVPDGLVGSGSMESCTEAALRADLFAASADTVGFDCGQPYHYYPIFLTEPIVLDQPLTVTAGPVTSSGGVSAAGTSMILSGSHRVRVFNVLKPGHLTLEGLRISAGAAHRCTTNPADSQGGGGLDVGGKGFATVINARFFGSSGDFGGAVHVHKAGTLEMERTRLWSSRAETPGTILAGGVVETTTLSGGGGVYSEGSLSLTNDTRIYGNQAHSGGGLVNHNGVAVIEASRIYNNSAVANGGGIQNSGDGVLASESVKVELNNTEVTGNTAGNYGGGIVNFNQAVAFITNSLIQGNSANSGKGGGLANVHENEQPGQPEAHLTNATLFGNTSAAGSALFNGPLNAIVYLDSSTVVSNTVTIPTTTGGALAMEGGALFMHNSILARNWDSKAGTPNPSDCTRNLGGVVSQGFNFVGFGGSCFSTEQIGDTFGTTTPLDPLLFSAKKNGGLTSTCALKAGSPALDLGDSNNCPATDQRGTQRPQGGGCDIGAYEAMQVSAAGAQGQEGTAAPQTLKFKVSLPGTAVQNVQVEYYTLDGTAKGCTGGPCPGGDYLRTAGTLTIPTGESMGQVAVELIPDDLDEPDETFRLVLSGSTNAFLWEDEATGTILNDDAPLQNFFAIQDATVTEGDAGTQDAIFQVTLATAEEFTDTVDYTTADDTALAGSDYTAVSGTLTFAPGETMQEIRVPILGDRLDEDTEQFFVRLSNPLITPIGTGEATGTILDNDGGMVGNTSYLPVIAKR